MIPRQANELRAFNGLLRRQFVARGWGLLDSPAGCSFARGNVGLPSFANARYLDGVICTDRGESRATRLSMRGMSRFTSWPRVDKRTPGHSLGAERPETLPLPRAEYFGRHTDSDYPYPVEE
jgi:hypothetical protein